VTSDMRPVVLLVGRDEDLLPRVGSRRASRVCGRTPIFPESVLVHTSDASDGRWGVSTVKRMLKAYQFYETNEKGGGFSSSVLKWFLL
jgi:hypothetical protein